MKAQRKKEGQNEEAQEGKKSPIEMLGDINIGGFGGIFKGIGQLIDFASQLAKKGEGIIKEGEFSGKSPAGKEFKGVYGFNIRTMAGEKPTVQTFGNIRKTPKGPVVKEAREPMVDIFDEVHEIRIIAELPGVSEGSIKTELAGDILTISAQENQRKYHREVLLPKPVKPETMYKVFKHGILEIRLEKK